MYFFSSSPSGFHFAARRTGGEVRALLVCAHSSSLAYDSTLTRVCSSRPYSSCSPLKTSHHHAAAEPCCLFVSRCSRCSARSPAAATRCRRPWLAAAVSPTRTSKCSPTDTGSSFTCTRRTTTAPTALALSTTTGACLRARTWCPGPWCPRCCPTRHRPRPTSTRPVGRRTGRRATAATFFTFRWALKKSGFRCRCPHLSTKHSD